MGIFSCGGIFFKPGAGGNIDLAPDDGMDALLDAFFVKFHHAVHDAVVGDGKALHTQFLGAGDKGLDAAGAVQQGIFGV